MRGVRVSNAVLVAAIVAWLAADIPIYGWLFRSPHVTALTEATHGLVTSTLLAYAISAAIVAPWLWLGRQTPALVGIRARDLPLGAAALVLGYLALQASLLAAAALAGPVHAGDALLADPGEVGGIAIAQLFGTTLVEEAFYRGFLLRQLLLRTGRRAAFVLSALLFAVSHVPNRLWLGLPPLDMIPDALGLFGGGLLAAWIYTRTENLFLVVALHFLWNAPLPLVAVPFPAQWLVAVPMLVIVAWIFRTMPACTASRSPS